MSGVDASQLDGHAVGQPGLQLQHTRQPLLSRLRRRYHWNRDERRRCQSTALVDRVGFNDRLRFTDSQIIDALKRVEAGLAVPELCRELGISTATFYKWRSKFGGMDASLMARMKELEEENRRLRKMYVEEKLKAEIVSEALAKKW